MTVKQSAQTAKLVKRTVESVDITKPEETLHLATDLARFIKENRLFQLLQGKEYVNVEGWQYAGSRLGILPIVEQVDNISTEAEIKYQAKVRLVNLRNDQTVGAGFAICSNKEGGKKFFQEYAIASMAQTRAIGKAYRNALAWIIRAAGYEPTPAEEMDAHYETVTENKTDHNRKIEAESVKTNLVQEDNSADTKPCTIKQKEQILKLLNNSLITSEEKNKMLLGINNLTDERARQAIAKLKKTIETRGQSQAAA